MKTRRKKSIIWLVVMTMLLSVLQVMPIFANVSQVGLKIGDYIKFKTVKGQELLWRVQEKNQKGTLLVKEEDFISPQPSDKKDQVNKDTLEIIEATLTTFEKFSDLEKQLLRETNEKLKDNKNYLIEDVKDILNAFYIKEDSIMFKIGEGTKENPYILYTETKEQPNMVANKDKIIINGVELVGEASPTTVSFIVYVDGGPVAVQTVENDTINKKLVLTLGMSIKQGQVVTIKYDLPTDSKTAIAKIGEQSVLKQIPTTRIQNDTVDQVIPKETIITESIVGGDFRVGNAKNFYVTAKGEGALTFNWYRNDKLIYTETLTSAGMDVTSRYNIATIALGDAGTYKVVVSGLGGEKVTTCEVRVTQNQYTITTAASPAKGGSVSDNSVLQNGVYNENDVATVTAAPKSSYRFVNWTENGKEVSQDRSYSFKVTGNRNLIANYKYREPYIPQYTVYVEEEPAEGGTVRGDYTYNEGDYATLRATPKSGYTFESWSENGKVVSRSSEYSFTVKENRWLKANFEKEKPKEVSFKERWRELSSKEQRAIEENFEEYLPYTIIDETLSTNELDELMNEKFTEKQLRELARDMDLLEDIGIDLDWEVIKLKEVSRPSFADIRSSHWAYDNIIVLAKRGIVTGYPDQTFKPNNQLTVADTFTFLDRVLLLNDVTKMDLSRSTVEDYIYYAKNNWAFDHVASVSSKLTKSTLNAIESLGNKSLSRGLLAQVLYEVTDGKLKQTEKLVVFTDTFNSPYEKAIDYCITRGLLKGTSSDKMSPNKPVTRAEMMTILQRLDTLLD